MGLYADGSKRVGREKSMMQEENPREAALVAASDPPRIEREAVGGCAAGAEGPQSERKQGHREGDWGGASGERRRYEIGEGEGPRPGE